jgi:hypothetical protein
MHTLGIGMNDDVDVDGENIIGGSVTFPSRHFDYIDNRTRAILSAEQFCNRRQTSIYLTEFYTVNTLFFTSDERVRLIA